MVLKDIADTHKALSDIAKNKNYRPDIRIAAQALIDRMDQAKRLLIRGPENVSRAQIAQAIESIADARGVAALEKSVSKGAMIDTLENIGRALRYNGISKLKGLVPKKAGPVLSIAAFLIALPSIAEAAEEGRYGTVGVEIFDLIVPSVTPSQTYYHYDEATQEVVEVPCGTHGTLCGPIESLGNAIGEAITGGTEE